MRETNYKYKFSFVIPVYNVENYLAETVESILAQTMDFERNCEIIFVNDGSPDNSEEVCLRYREQFPNNITYIKQKNAGPGAARNRGITEAQGKYISLLDSDDKISTNTLAEVYKFIEAHYDEIDLVGIKWEFFEARQGSHPLNYKFTADRVIDLTKEYTNIQGSCAPAFFKEAVLRKHPFDPAVGRYSEDARLMGEILLDNPKFGVVTKPTYFYRKRLDQASSQDKNMIDRFWYLETPKRVWYDLFDYTRKKNGSIPKFIQFMAMYDLQWRFKQRVQVILTGSEQAQYESLLSELLQYISDDVILAQQQISIHQKLFILGEKHGELILKKCSNKNGKYYYHGTEIYDIEQVQPAVHVEILEGDKNMLCIEGFYSGLLLEGTQLQFRVGDKEYDTEIVDRAQRRIRFLGKTIGRQTCFKVVLPVASGDVIEAFIAGEVQVLPFIMHRFSYLSESARQTYRVCGEWLIRKKPYRLEVHRYTRLRRMLYELLYVALLAKRTRFRVFLQGLAGWRRARLDGRKAELRDLEWALIPFKSVVRNMYVIAFRMVYFTVRPFRRRPIWLLSDRIMTADDSGEVLFRYLQHQRHLNAKIYFALSEKSSEFTPLKQYGKVLKYGSLRHKLLSLLSSKVISSEATDYIINLFGGYVQDLVDLYNFDFIFLQHGIIRDDISGWLNRYNKNIKLFVTSTKPEYNSILNGDYGYDEKVVKLTGLPRYDGLRSTPKNKIIIMPTWREDLADRIDSKTGHRMYNPNFKKSDYFAFYQNLMNDRRVQEIMRKSNLKGEFYLHPSFQQHIVDFVGNDCFTIMRMPFDYPKAKAEGDMLITDYSSVAFDFAYLKKAVLYAQFDEDSFYKNHVSKEGYFTYKTDGFGPVTYNYEDTVKTATHLIQSSCAMQKKYQKRVDDFFAYNDRGNSERVYKAIMSMGKENS
jgi:glycosyltransferase involved in cell wall biosynthesis/CDP-glycerol glycerophosphotransferase (TagB/SpsB family)